MPSLGSLEWVDSLFSHDLLQWLFCYASGWYCFNDGFLEMVLEIGAYWFFGSRLLAFGSMHVLSIWVVFVGYAYSFSLGFRFVEMYWVFLTWLLSSYLAFCEHTCFHEFRWMNLLMFLWDGLEVCVMWIFIIPTLWYRVWSSCMTVLLKHMYAYNNVIFKCKMV